MTIPQAHRLRTESIALHRYFLNRKSNVHKGISLAEAIETSTANVLHIFHFRPSPLRYQCQHPTRRCHHGRRSPRRLVRRLQRLKKEAKVIMRKKRVYAHDCVVAMMVIANELIVGTDPMRNHCYTQFQHCAAGEAKAIAIARAQVSLIRQATMDAQSTPRAASCLSDVARVFTKHLSAEVNYTRVMWHE
jgi:hypothetical protein